MSLGRTTDTLETLFRTLETKLLHLELWCVTFLQHSGNTIRTKESRIKNSRKRIFRLHISKKVQFVIICEIEGKNQFPNNNVWNWCWLFYAANGCSVQVIDIESPTKRWAVIWHAITDFWLFLPYYLKKKHCFLFEIKNQEKEQKNLVPKLFCLVLTR